MAATRTLELVPPVDVVDVSDDHARLSVERLPRSANLLGCRVCGLTAQEHGVSMLHRFVRPELPAGYRYLDSVRVGDALTLRRTATERAAIRVAEVEPAAVADDLLWVRTACREAFLLHPATIVAEAEVEDDVTAVAAAA
jgi:hypothetical protein